MYEKQPSKSRYTTAAAPEETTSDHNKKKRLSTAPVLVQAEAQCNQCTSFMILEVMRKNGRICGAIKAFLVYLTKRKETLTKQ